MADIDSMTDDEWREHRIKHGLSTGDLCKYHDRVVCSHCMGNCGQCGLTGVVGDVPPRLEVIVYESNPHNYGSRKELLAAMRGKKPNLFKRLFKGLVSWLK